MTELCCLRFANVSAGVNDVFRDFGYDTRSISANSVYDKVAGGRERAEHDGDLELEQCAMGKSEIDVDFVS